jgi:hypothetical protein
VKVAVAVAAAKAAAACQGARAGRGRRAAQILKSRATRQECSTGYGTGRISRVRVAFAVTSSRASALTGTRAGGHTPPCLETELRGRTWSADMDDCVDFTTVVEGGRIGIARRTVSRTSETLHRPSFAPLSTLQTQTRTKGAVGPPAWAIPWLTSARRWPLRLTRSTIRVCPRQRRRFAT